MTAKVNKRRSQHQRHTREDCSHDGTKTRYQRSKRDTIATIPQLRHPRELGLALQPAPKVIQETATDRAARRAPGLSEEQPKTSKIRKGEEKRRYVYTVLRGPISQTGVGT